jgi:hypothetical protein
MNRCENTAINDVWDNILYKAREAVRFSIDNELFEFVELHIDMRVHSSVWSNIGAPTFNMNFKHIICTDSQLEAAYQALEQL